MSAMLPNDHHPGPRCSCRDCLAAPRAAALTWHPHTERPAGDGPTTALIATRDDEGAPYVLGMYLWREGAWRCEVFESGVADSVYWWALEDDVLAGLPS